MAKEQIIKGGQITLPRIMFLALFGALVVASVAGGDIWLKIGYWGLTIVIGGVLYLVAIDYGVQMEKVGAQEPTTNATSAAEPEGVQAAVTASRVKRKANRPAKRRR
jgi:hypothetical protein